MGDFLLAVGIFGIWFICRKDISLWRPSFQFLGHLFGVGLPICILFEPFKYWVGNYIKTRIIENSTMRILKANIEAMNQSSSTNTTGTNQSYNPNQPHIDESREFSHSLLTPEQIEKLNSLRSQVSLYEVKQYPLIHVSGNKMTNLVPEAGMFTAKIKRHGNIQNLVLLLSTVKAISDFEKICYSYGALPKDFWAEGYLLPSRTDRCYSVLFVTAFRLCGKRILF